MEMDSSFCWFGDLGFWFCLCYWWRVVQRQADPACWLSFAHLAVGGYKIFTLYLRAGDLLSSLAVASDMPHLCLVHSDSKKCPALLLCQARCSPLQRAAPWLWKFVVLMYLVSRACLSKHFFLETRKCLINNGRTWRWNFSFFFFFY